MAPNKRKGSTTHNTAPPAAKKIRKEVQKTASSDRPKRGLGGVDEEEAPIITQRNKKETQESVAPRGRGRPKKQANADATPKTSASPAKRPLTNGQRGRPPGKASAVTSKKTKPAATKPARRNEVSVEVDEPTEAKDPIQDVEEESDGSDGPSYWLMKAEPESRIEKGVDVKFSIDDLKAATEPEPWDGELTHSISFECG